VALPSALAGTTPTALAKVDKEGLTPSAESVEWSVSLERKLEGEKQFFNNSFR